MNITFRFNEVLGVLSYTAATANALNASQVRSAGEIFRFATNITGNSGNNYRNSITENPIIYIRVEMTDETGVPYELSNLKLNNGADRGSVEKINDCIVSNTIVTEASGKKVRIYKIDTAPITDGTVAIGGNYIDNRNRMYRTTLLALSYEIATTALTPEQSYEFKNMLFTEDPTSTSMYTIATLLPNTDPLYAQLGATGSVIGVSAAWANNFYKVNEKASMLAELKIKQKYGTSYQIWTPGDPPIAIGITAGSEFNIQTSIINNAGVNVPGPTEVYLPIPKVGEDWGSILETTTQLSLILKTAITNTLVPGPSGNGIYTAYYGVNVTPSGDGPTLKAQTSKFSTSPPANLSTVNCIKIVAINVPNLAIGNFVLSLQADSTQTVPPMAEGLTDQWHPLYYQDLTNSKGDPFKDWYSGDSISIQSALGIVRGQLFRDTDIDGILDSGEEISGTWSIRVYDKSDLSNPLQTLTTAANGSYEIFDLLTTANQYVFTVTNPTPAAYMFTKVSSNAAGNKFVDSADHATGTATVTARRPISPALTTAVYNIGTVPNAPTTLTWQSQNTARGTISGTASVSGYPTVSIGTPPTATARTGYTFEGWALSATGAVNPAIGKTGPYGAGDGTIGYNSINYWAVFSANPYTVTYSGNGNSIGAAPVDTGGNNPVGTNRYVIGSTVAVLPHGSLGRANHTFAGWNTAVDRSGTAYVAGSTISNIRSNITLYAQWDPIRYTITFDAGIGGTLTGTVSYPNILQGTPWSASGITVPIVVVASHYVFKGWTPAIPAGSSAITGHAVYTASFARDSHTVAYDGNGHTSGRVPGTVTYIHGANTTVVPHDSLYRAGWYFTGWNTSADGTGTAYADGDAITGIIADIILYAQWNPIPPDPETETKIDIIPPPEDPSVEKITALTGNPFTDLVNGNVPLGNLSSGGAWSLLSLILSLIAIIIAVILIILPLKKRKDEQDDDKIEYAQADRDRDESTDEEETRKGRLFRILTVLAGILTPIIWLILDELNQPMVWINRWTIFVVIIFILHIIFLFTYLVRRNKKDDDDAQTVNYSEAVVR